MIMDVLDRKIVCSIMKNIKSQLLELEDIKDKYTVRARETTDEMTTSQNNYFVEIIGELQLNILTTMITKAHQLDMNIDFLRSK